MNMPDAVKNTGPPEHLPALAFGQNKYTPGAWDLCPDTRPLQAKQGQGQEWSSLPGSLAGCWHCPGQEGRDSSIHAPTEELSLKRSLGQERRPPPTEQGLGSCVARPEGPHCFLRNGVSGRPSKHPAA